MLRLFQNYHKSAMGIIVALFVVGPMLFFGVNFGGGGSGEPYAIKVGEQEVSYGDFYKRKRQVEEQYRQALGDRYHLMAPRLLKDLPQRLADELINDLLLKQEAQRYLLYAGDKEVQKKIVEDVFRNNFSPQQYRAYLSQAGLTARAFEDQLRVDSLIDGFREILRDVSFASRAEALALLRQEETQYDVEYVEIVPSSLTGEVSDPSQEQLDEFYEANAPDFETEEQVRYGLVSLSASDHEDLVEVLPEDVEFYYADNEKRYREPEQAKIRHIQLNYPEESDPERMLELKQRAEEVHARAQSGEDFASLVTEYSDDITTKFSGGDLGWIEPGDKNPYTESVFELKQGGLTELVEADYGYHIVFVDEYKEGRQKELDEVRAEIEKTIRQDEAPAYASARAEELLAEWSESGKALEEFAKSKNLKFHSSEKLLAKRQDPKGGFGGLTAKVLENALDERQIVELRNLSIVIEINEFREPDVPALDEIKDEVVLAFKRDASRDLAQERANTVVAGLGDGTFSDIKTAAEELKLELKSETELGAKKTPGVFAQEDVQRSLFATTQAKLPPDRYFQQGDSYYVYQVSDVRLPTQETLKEKLGDYRQRAGGVLSQSLVSSIVEKLKGEADVNINQGLLSES